MTTPFVGRQRKANLQSLLTTFDQVLEGGPTAVLLSSPLGWGKTRLVHEFYRKLAATQVSNYWPQDIAPGSARENILLRRKVTHPSRFSVPANSSPQWMWWGLLAGRREDGTLLSAIRTDDTQWLSHSAALQHRIPPARRALRGTAELPGLIPVIGSIIGCFILPVGIAATVLGVSEELWKDGRRWLDLRGRSRSLKEPRDIDDGPELGSMVDLADSVVRLSHVMHPITPIIIFIEDAHFVDIRTSAFISRIFHEPSSPILVILAAQTDELNLQLESQTGLAVLLENMGSTNVHHMRLQPLGDGDLADLVLDRFPATSSDVVDSLVRHYNPNPLALEIALSLDSVTAAVSDGALRLTRYDVQSLPYTIQDLYAEKWRSLPSDVKTTLALATIQGRIFHTKPLREAAARVGIASTDESLFKAEEPYHWIRDWADAPSETKYFVEEILSHMAHDNRNAQLSSRKWAAAREATAIAISEMRLRGQLDDIDESIRLMLLNTQVKSALDGVYGDKVAAAESALDLSRMGLSPEYCLALAIQAEAWAALTAGPESTLALEARFAQASELHRLGRLRDSRDQLERVIDVASNAGLSSSQVAHSARELLAQIMSQAGEQVAARQMTERAIDGFNALGSKRDVLRAKTNLAGICVSLGDYRSGLRLNQEVLAARESELGPDSFMTVVSRRNVARSWAHLHYYVEAILLMFEVKASFDRTLGHQHEESILARAELGNLMTSMGDYTSGLKHQRAALAEADEFLGNADIARLKIALDLVMCLFLQRDSTALTEGSRILSEVILTAKQNLAEGHFIALQALDIRAGLREQEGDLQGASSDYGEIAEAWAGTIGATSPECIEAHLARCRLVKRIGDAQAAFNELSEYAERAERYLGESHPVTLQAWLQLAATAIVATPEDADALVGRALRLASDAEGAEQILYTGTTEIAGSYLESRQYDKAVRYASLSLDIAERRYGRDNPVTNTARDVLTGLIRLLHSQDQG